MAGLYLKNSLEEKKIRELGLPQVVRILRLIRREKYVIYKQIANFAVNIAQQTRNSVNAQIIEQFINGPESPIRIKDEIEKITERVCAQEKTTGSALLT